MNTENIFLGYGFIVTRSTKKVTEFVKGELVAYLLAGRSIRVVVDDDLKDYYDFSRYDNELYHNSNMIKFKKRDNGHGLIHYGRKVSLPDEKALSEFLGYLCSLR